MLERIFSKQIVGFIRMQVCFNHINQLIDDENEFALIKDGI